MQKSSVRVETTLRVRRRESLRTCPSVVTTMARGEAPVRGERDDMRLRVPRGCLASCHLTLSRSYPLTPQQQIE